MKRETGLADSGSGCQWMKMSVGKGISVTNSSDEKPAMLTNMPGASLKPGLRSSGA